MAMRTLKQLFDAVVSAIRGPTGQILQKSLDYTSGLETQYQNRDKLLQDKGKDLQLYDTMMLDDRIKSVIMLKKMMTLSVGGSFVPASEEEADIEICDWVRDVLEHMTLRWWDFFDNLMDAMVYGFKVGEKVFAVEEGKIVLKNVKFMHSIHFDFGYDEYGALSELRIGQNQGQPTIVAGDAIKEKFVIYVNPYLKDGNMYGSSDLMEVYAQYYAKYQIFRFRNIYLQNYGQPIPVVVYDSKNTSVAEKDEMKDFMDNLQDNMYLMMPGMRPPKKDGSYPEKLMAKMEVTLLENTKTTGTDQYEKTIDQLDRQISRRLLVPDRVGFTTDKFGSKASADDSLDILKVIIKDLHGRLEDCANAVIKQLVDFNFPGVENYTTWQFEKIDERIEYNLLNTLITQGVVDKREKWIRTWTGIPELTQEEQDEIDEQKEQDKKDAQDAVRLAGPAPSFPGRPSEGGFPKRQDEPPAKEGMKADATDFKKIKEQFETAEADFVRDYNQIHIGITENVLKQIEKKKIIEDKNYTAIKSLRIDKSDLKRLISLYLAKLYVEGKGSALEDVERRLPRAQMAVPAFGTEPPHSFLDGEDWLDRSWIDAYLSRYGSAGGITKADADYLRQLRQRSFFLTGEIEQGVLKTVFHAIDSGIKSGTMTRTVINQIDSALSEDRKKYATTIARTNAADAFNTGRMNSFEKYRSYIEKYQFSAVLDDQTTPFCEEHDGQIVSAGDPGFISLPAHYNCRSIWIPIFTGEGESEDSPFYNYEKKLDTWGTDVSPEYRLPAAGFGGVSAADGGWGR